MERRSKSGRKSDSRKSRSELPRKFGRRGERVKVLHLSDPEWLRRFVTEHGKIMPSRLTGLSSKQQRQLQRAVKRFRVIGLLP